MGLSVNEFTSKFVQDVAYAVYNGIEKRVRDINGKIEQNIINNIDTYIILDEFRPLMRELDMASLDFTYYEKLKSKIFKNKDLIAQYKENIDTQLRSIKSYFNIGSLFNIYRYRLATSELGTLKESIIVHIMNDRLLVKEDWRNTSEFSAILQADLLNGALEANIDQIKDKCIKLYCPELIKLEAKYK